MAEAQCTAILPGRFDAEETKGRRCGRSSLVGSDRCGDHCAPSERLARQGCGHKNRRPKGSLGELKGRPPYDAVDPKTGLPSRQFEALLAIRRLTAKMPATSHRAIGVELGIWQRAVEGLVARLTLRGLVGRTGERGNKSLGGTILLTEEGQRLAKGRR